MIFFFSVFIPSRFHHPASNLAELLYSNGICLNLFHKKVTNKK